MLAVGFFLLVGEPVEQFEHNSLILDKTRQAWCYCSTVSCFVTVVCLIQDIGYNLIWLFSELSLFDTVSPQTHLLQWCSQRFGEQQ